jgi:hypothetical protein
MLLMTYTGFYFVTPHTVILLVAIIGLKLWGLVSISFRFSLMYEVIRNFYWAVCIGWWPCGREKCAKMQLMYWSEGPINAVVTCYWHFVVTVLWLWNDLWQKATKFRCTRVGIGRKDRSCCRGIQQYSPIWWARGGPSFGWSKDVLPLWQLCGHGNNDPGLLLLSSAFVRLSWKGNFNLWLLTMVRMSRCAALVWKSSWECGEKHLYPRVHGHGLTLMNDTM